MDTAIATAERPSLIESPAGNIVLQNRREVLFTKIQDIQIYNAETNKQGYFGALVDRTSCIFMYLCCSKFGLSCEQLKKLNQEELSELAAVVYEQSRKWYFIQTSVLTLIPIVGWACLVVTNDPSMTPRDSESNVRNMRYYRWYKKIRKLSGKNFSPDMTKR